MVDHLSETTLCYHLVDRVHAEQENIIDSADSLQQRRLVNQNCRRENERKQGLHDLQRNSLRSTLSVTRSDGVNNKIDEGRWRLWCLGGHRVTRVGTGGRRG